MIGKALEPIFAPIGFSWQMVVALVPGMAAREVAVAVLGTVYSIAGAEENVGALASVLSADWSLATGLAFTAGTSSRRNACPPWAWFVARPAR